VWLSGFAAQAQTARIAVLQPKGLPMALVTVEGGCLPDDGERFAEIAARHPRAAVLFNSPGGAAIAGLQMGQVIRLRRYATVVPKDMLCASACGIAWVAGTPRFMETGGHIGFHAAVDAKTEQ